VEKPPLRAEGRDTMPETMRMKLVRLGNTEEIDVVMDVRRLLERQKSFIGEGFAQFC